VKVLTSPFTTPNYVVFNYEAVYGPAAARPRGWPIMRECETVPDIARALDVSGHEVGATEVRQVASNTVGVLPPTKAAFSCPTVPPVRLLEGVRPWSNG
jgi:hypothetical protein